MFRVYEGAEAVQETNTMQHASRGLGAIRELSRHFARMSWAVWECRPRGVHFQTDSNTIHCTKNEVTSAELKRLLYVTYQFRMVDFLDTVRRALGRPKTPAGDTRGSASASERRDGWGMHSDLCSDHAAACGTRQPGLRRDAMDLCGR